MSILFTASEILTMAIEIEKNGMRFYDFIAERTKDGKVMELFTFLVHEEVRHKVVFQKMLDRLPKIELTVSENEEYHAYLGALTRSKVFKDDINVDELAKEIKNDITAIDIGIDAEKDSILFYNELMDRVFEEDMGEIETVIKEEKSHYTKLMALKAELIG